MSRLIHALRAAVPALALVAASACQAAPPPGDAPKATAAPAAKAKPDAHAHHADRSPVASKLPTVLVHKSPTCGCCGAWVDHMRAAGFTVEVDETSAMGEVKERVGIPPGKGSCHTSEVGGYFVEGHVPAEDIIRLLTEKPKARGITAPGMPIGSPGMEVHGQGSPRYQVELVRNDGSTEVFAEHGEGAPVVEEDHSQHKHEH
jgi:hypothetical protein